MKISISKSCVMQSLEKMEKKLKDLQAFSMVVASVRTTSSEGIINYQWFTEIETRSAETNAQILKQAMKRKRTNPVFFNESETSKIRAVWKKGIDRFNKDGSPYGMLGAAKKVSNMMKDAVLSHILNSQSEAGRMKPIKHYLQVMKDACYGPGKPRFVKTGALIKSFKSDAELIK